MKRTLEIVQPLALIMLLGGCLLAGQAFFGGEPGGEIGRQLVQHRWQFVLMAVIGLLLLVGYALAPDSE